MSGASPCWWTAPRPLATARWTWSGWAATSTCVSAHKMYGPTGIGALLARTQLLERMPPLQFGGEMVERVTVEDTRFQPPPYRFEAGTPHFLGAVGFAAAVDHLGQVGLEQAAREEQTLARALWEGLRAIPGVELPVAGRPRRGLCPSPCRPSTPMTWRCC